MKMTSSVFASQKFRLTARLAMMSRVDVLRLWRRNTLPSAAKTVQELNTFGLRPSFEGMDKISDVSLGPLESSAFVRPRRFHYKQDGVAKCWDLLLSRRTVAVVIYNKTRDRLVLVKQFRPAVYVAEAIRQGQLQPSASGAGSSNPPPPATNDAEKVVDPKEDGVTLEICAGIVDREVSEREIAKTEVLEECGYDVPLEGVVPVQSVLGGVGTSGERMFLYYAEVTDDMRVDGAGGGLAEEGELIEVAEVSVPEVKKLMKSSKVNIPTFTMYGLYWFLLNKTQQ